jgi:hypothetical protein
MGMYVASADDAPGAAVIGFLLMLAAVLFGMRSARNRLPIWAGRTALAVGVLVAAFAAFLTHAVTVAALLFAQPPDVPSVSESAPSPQWAAAGFALATKADSVNGQLAGGSVMSLLTRHDNGIVVAVLSSEF